MTISTININTGTVLSSNVLDAAWRRWVATQNPDMSVYFNSYKNVTRRNPLAVDFEHWLFVEGKGATVRQNYSNRVLEFPNESTASMFVLKWAT